MITMQISLTKASQWGNSSDTGLSQHRQPSTGCRKVPVALGTKWKAKTGYINKNKLKARIHCVAISNHINFT